MDNELKAKKLVMISINNKRLEDKANYRKVIIQNQLDIIAKRIKRREAIILNFEKKKLEVQKRLNLDINKRDKFLDELMNLKTKKTHSAAVKNIELM